MSFMLCTCLLQEDYSTHDMRFRYWQYLVQHPKDPLIVGYCHDTVDVDLSENSVALQIHII